MAMKGLPLSRRALLCSVIAGAGQLLSRRVARARDLPSPHAASSPRQSTAGLIPRHVLFGGADRSVVRLSPDGRRIAFLAPIAGVLNLWVADVRRPTKARSLTRVSDRDLGSWVVWLPNNRHVVFFRDQGGDENWQAHRVDLDTGEILALSPAPGVKAYVQQMSHHFPDELLIAHNQRDPRYSDIFRVNVVTGQATLLETNDHFGSMFTDPQFRVRYGIRQTDDGATEYLKRGTGGEWEVFARIDMADSMSTRGIEFSDDGAQLYWMDSRGRDTAAIVAEDLRTGARQVIAHDERADMAEALLTPRTYRPLAAVSVFTRRRWRAIDPACAPDFAYLAKLSPGDLSITSVSDDNRHWLLYYERDAVPGQYSHYDRAGRTARFLFGNRAALNRAPLVPMEPVVIRARDGLPLVSYLSRPRGAIKSVPSPMLLLVHGGPWARDIWALSSKHQWLAHRGYAVLSVNFRGSTGSARRSSTPPISNGQARCTTISSTE